MQPLHGADESTACSDEEPQLYSTHNELEKLGRKRPEVFSSTLAEISFCFSLLASMLMAVRLSQD